MKMKMKIYSSLFSFFFTSGIDPEVMERVSGIVSVSEWT